MGEGGAGAADVDGDGVPELVLTGRSSTLGPASCGGSLLKVLDGRSLAARLTASLGGLDLAGGAIGRLGGPGQDLIAYARAPCTLGSDPLVAVDLRTGSSRIVLDGVRGDEAGPWMPFLADLDGNGVDEAIARDGDRTVAIDPGRNSKPEVLAANAIPLVSDLRSPGVRRSSCCIGRLPWSAIPRSISWRSAGPDRAAPCIVHLEQSSLRIGSVASPPQTLPEVELATGSGAPPPAWIGDLDGSGLSRGGRAEGDLPALPWRTRRLAARPVLDDDHAADRLRLGRQPPPAGCRGPGLVDRIRIAGGPGPARGDDGRRRLAQRAVQPLRAGGARRRRHPLFRARIRARSSTSIPTSAIVARRG